MVSPLPTREFENSNVAVRFSISFRDTILDQSKKFTGNPDADINLRLIIDVERNET